MSGSNKAPSKALKVLLDSVNPKLKEYFDVRRERAELDLKFTKKQAKLAAKKDKADAPLAKREDELVTELRAMIIPSKVLLLSGKLRSVKTTFGVISFKEKTGGFKITDPAGLEKQVRAERKLTDLGAFTRTWKPNAEKLKKFLATQPKAALRYARFVEQTGGYDELYVQPNDAYLTDYDPDRLTEKKVNLGPAPDDVKDEQSPDA